MRRLSPQVSKLVSALGLPLPTGLLLGTGALAYAPIVDPATYAFVRWNLDGSLGIARSSQFTTFGVSDGCQWIPSVKLGDLAQIF